MDIQRIREEDNADISVIIKASLEAVGLNIPGTAYTDPQLNDLFHYYQNQDRAAYFIALDNDKVIGGVGFGPVTDSICELQKCYVKASERNQGVGQELLKHVINEAKRNGFKYMYLESSHLLQEAIPFYEKNGFRSLNKPLPNQQNHHAMDIWVLKEISKSC